MADLFAWKPVNETTGEVNFRVRRTQYGDGYAQSVRDGINSIYRRWPLNFTDRKTTIQQIANFLDRHAGLSFLWKPPFGASEKLFSCDAYTIRDIGGDVYTLSATFDERFNP